MNRVRRNPSEVTLDGIRSADPRTIRDACVELASRDALIAADVSIGSWRTHHAAAEMFAQLALPDPSSATDSESGSDPALSERSTVGRRIDLETGGDRVVLKAHELAAAAALAMTGRTHTTFAVATGAVETSWERGDAFFVRFLAQMLRGTGHRVLLVHGGPDEPSIPAGCSVDWVDLDVGTPAAAVEPNETLAGLVPGIVTPDVVEALSLSCRDRRLLIPLRAGCFLIPTELRRDPTKCAADRDRVAAAAAAIPWLTAYAACCGSDVAANPPVLWAHARRLFDSGALSSALRLLDCVIPMARSRTERGVFELLAQSARIGTGAFAEAGTLPDPDEQLPPDLRGWLWHTKGWALTMTGRGAEAERCLEQARLLLRRSEDNDEYLYVLNISALNQLKLGHWDQALSMEEAIRSALDRIEAGRYQIRYINSLNLARLYLRKQDYDRSEQYYGEAFATSSGVHSDSDAIYAHVCRARLCEARGNTIDARDAWGRAALYWMTSPVPEAVSPRVVDAIFSTRRRPPDYPAHGSLFDEVSAVLAERLLANGAALSDLDRAASESECSPATFVRADSIEKPADWSGPWWILRGAGACFLGAASRTIARTRYSQSAQLLRQLLWRLVCPSSDAAIDEWTVVVDDRQGLGLPQTEAEMLAACLPLKVETVISNGHELSLSHVRTAIQSQLRFRLGPGVARVEQQGTDTIVAFKRYRAPRRLAGDAGEIVRWIRDAGSLSETTTLPPLDDPARSRLLRMLQHDRIIEPFLPATLSASAFLVEGTA